MEGIAANAVTGSEGQDANVASKGENEVQAQIRKLEARLREAVRTEEYEMAAECRDQIRALKEAQS